MASPYGLDFDVSPILAAYEGRQGNRMLQMMQQRQMERQDRKDQEETIEQQLERDRERYVYGARILEGVTDNDTYQAARQQAVQAGIDLTGAPASYDPAYVEAVRKIGRAFSPGQAAQPTEMQRNYEWLVRTNPGAADNFLARQTEQAPLTVNNGDGTYTIIPRASLAGQKPGGERVDANQLRSWAEDAIKKGADPAAVNRRLEEMLGGPTPTASGTFP